MQFSEIPIHPFLQPHIERLWVFQNDYALSNTVSNVVAPNGRIKLLIPFRNTIAARTKDCYHVAPEYSIILTGLIDGPCSVFLGENNSTGTIGVEFSPLGAYRFFSLRLSDIRNQLLPLSELGGLETRQLELKMAEAISIPEKINQLQQFLLNRFCRRAKDALFEYCTEQILATKGRITVNELAKKVGYSPRWLNLKFDERLGVSPKTLSSIIRFRHCYQLVTASSPQSVGPTEFYDFYYDQSHFIKAFRRFTGYSPTHFAQLSNELGKKFYRE